MNAQTTGNEESDANANKNIDEIVRSSEPEPNDQVAAIEKAIVNAINAQIAVKEDPDQSGYETDESSKIVTSEQRTEESDDQPKTNDPVAAIEKAIVNPINAQITVNEDSGANKGVIDESSESNEDSGANEGVIGKSSSLTKKIEKTTFLDKVQGEELGNKQNDFIVAKKQERRMLVGEMQ